MQVWCKARPLCGYEGLPSYKRITMKQVGGSHYQLPIEPVDYIMQNGLTYLQGNVIKYITRYKNKNGKEDLLKAIHYIEMIIEREYDAVSAQ